MISIIIPTYNRANVLSDTLESVMAQTYVEWQCIIVDDGSTDNTFSMALDFADRDERFICLKNIRKKGAQGARNTGIEAAQGEWICLFDSDDKMYPNYLEEMIKSIESNVDILVCQANIFNAKSQKKVGILDKIHSKCMHVDLLRERAYVAYDVTLIKRSKLIEINLLDEECPSMQEWDTHIRLSKIATYKPIDIPLCEWRIGGDDAISSNNDKHIFGLVYIYLKHQCEFRKFAYRHFLNALSQLVEKKKFRKKIFLNVPELLLYIPLKKLYNLIHDSH